MRSVFQNLSGLSAPLIIVPVESMVMLPEEKALTAGIILENARAAKRAGSIKKRSPSISSEETVDKQPVKNGMCETEV